VVTRWVRWDGSACAGERKNVSRLFKITNDMWMGKDLSSPWVRVMDQSVYT
jgi:hypothetical protein